MEEWKLESIILLSREIPGPVWKWTSDKEKVFCRAPKGAMIPWEENRQNQKSSKQKNDGKVCYIISKNNAQNVYNSLSM